MTRSFSVKTREAERLATDIEIGKQYRPRRRTLAVMEELRGEEARQEAITDANIRDAEAAEEAGDDFTPTVDPTPYADICILIEDGDGKQPTHDELAEHLDFAVAAELRRFLFPEFNPPKSDPTEGLSVGSSDTAA